MVEVIRKNIINHISTASILSFLIIIIALIPRSIEVLNHNYLWGFDQGEHYLAVYDIVINKNLTLIGTKVGGGGGFFQGPGWYYLLSIPYILTSGDPYGGMLLMLFIGIGTVFIAFRQSQIMFDYKTGSVIAFLIAISPTIIPQSRFIWPPFPISFLTVLYLYSLFRLLSGNRKYLPIATFIIGMMSHFEIATSGTLLLQFVLFSPILFWKHLTSLKFIALSMITFLLSLSPLLLFDIRNQNIVIKGMINMINNKNAVKLPYDWIINNHFQVFTNNFKGTFYGADKMWFVFLAFIIIGSIMYFLNKSNTQPKKLFVLYLLTSPFLLFIVFMKFSQYMWDWWILQMPIIYCFLFGVLLVSFWKDKYFKMLIVFVLCLFMIFYTKQTIAWYKNDLNDYGGTHKINGKTDALDFIYKDANGEPFSLFVYTPPVYTYAYDYLALWYGKNRYGYVPGKDKKNVFYLWIEVDPNKPWAHKGWQETVIKEGKVLKTIELPKSKFIIEKRVIE